MTAIQHLEFGAGDDFIFDAELTDGGTGEALDLTDASVAWRIGVDGVYSLEASTANGMVEIIDAVNGVIHVSVLVADHSAITAGFWRHECQVVLATGESSDQFEGRLTVRQSLFP